MIKRCKNPVDTYFINREGWMRGLVVDPLEVAVRFVLYVLVELLVDLRPDLRQVSHCRKQDEGESLSLNMFFSVIDRNIFVMTKEFSHFGQNA